MPRLPLPSAMTFREVIAWSIPLHVGIISLGRAVSLAGEHIEWTGWIYFSIAILVPLHKVYFKRKTKSGAESWRTFSFSHLGSDLLQVCVR